MTKTLLLLIYTLRNYLVDCEWEPIAHGNQRVILRRKREGRVRTLWLFASGAMMAVPTLGSVIAIGFASLFLTFAIMDGR
ncbi:hypothetical protein [Litoribrevibacter albus]|uniref:Uncharacterized protein n=1 Tax=Litoribrevibacter albus TaxID=1473156 RepID=A0AA37SE01_9GAMM|nr:hypothetical protein [Litoribrevibacter albus]GLQ33290.1 hypothetical protein GCM10007876_37700 [Litoribrevibacter albus]